MAKKEFKIIISVKTENNVRKIIHEFTGPTTDAFIVGGKEKKGKI